MKARKRPIVVNVELYDGSLESLVRVQSLTDKKIFRSNIAGDAIGTIVIPTLEGDMLGLVGDYIIRGVHGEVYPCKPDIFHKTYEIVEE